MEPRNADHIFHEALMLEGADARLGYVKGACGGDLDLQNKVERLLVALGDAGDLMATEPGGAPFAISISEGAGDVIGRYKLLQKIGEGGMGAVYMAEQTVPLSRTVALKIIKLGMDTKQVVARFEAERQALAMMDHPNIAKVLDAGATDTGRPYFVMELVRGVPVTEYCDKNKLSTMQRIELFVPVCQAIQHAHQKGIVHRDIKPSNVMVTLHDGNPVPKVIDFGIAKATNQKLTEKTLFTNYSQMIGTPAYMSPEQAEMSGLDIDTRTDVYSLGVLLYELLTGTTPFPSKELLSKGYGEIQRIIAEDEPPRPSTRLSTMDNDTWTVVSRNRNEEVSALDRVCQGDLDWIVMKTLEKDRTHRYETVNGLVADLKRHMSNVESIAYSADGNWLVTATNDLVVKCWDMNSMELAATFRHPADAVPDIRFIRAGISHDGEFIEFTTLFDQGDVYIYRRSEPGGPYLKLSGVVYPGDLSFSPTENRVLVSYREKGKDGGRVELLDLETKEVVEVVESNPKGNRRGEFIGAEILITQFDYETRSFRLYQPGEREPLNDFPTNRGRTLGMACNPDGRSVALSSEKDIQVFSRETGEVIATLGGFGGWVGAVEFSPDGKWLAAASADNTVRLFDTHDYEKQNVLLGHVGDAGCVSWAPDSKTFATGGSYGNVLVWDVGSVADKGSFRGGSSIPGPDSVHLVVEVDGAACVMDMRTSDVLWSRPGETPAGFARGGSEVVTSQGATLRRRGVRTGDTLAEFHPPGLDDLGEKHTFGVSPDGRFLCFFSSDGRFLVWEMADPTRIVALHQEDTRPTWGGELRPLEFSYDSRVVVFGFPRTKKVVIWDLEAMAERAVLIEDESRIISATAFVPGADELLTGNWNSDVTSWNLESLERERDLRGHTQGVFAVAVSPDGNTIASGGEDQSVKLWHAQKGRELLTLQPGIGPVGSLAFTADGNRLVVTGKGGAVKIIDVAGVE